MKDDLIVRLGGLFGEVHEDLLYKLQLSYDLNSWALEHGRRQYRV